MVLSRIEVRAYDHLIPFGEQAAGKLQTEGMAVFRCDLTCLKGLDKVIPLNAVLLMEAVLCRRHLPISVIVGAAYCAFKKGRFCLATVEGVIDIVLQCGLFGVLHIIHRPFYAVAYHPDTSPRHISTVRSRRARHPI